MPAGAARILDEAVAHDLERGLGFDDLDRLVGEVGRGVGYSFDAVERGARAPGADHDLGQDERLAVMGAADRQERRPAFAPGDHPRRRRLGKGPHDGVEHAIADDAARGAGGGIYRIDDGARRRVDGDRPHIALAVRNIDVAEAAYGAIGRRADHGDGTVDGGVDLRR